MDFFYNFLAGFGICLVYIIFVCPRIFRAFMNSFGMVRTLKRWGLQVVDNTSLMAGGIRVITNAIVVIAILIASYFLLNSVFIGVCIGLGIALLIIVIGCFNQPQLNAIVEWILGYRKCILSTKEEIMSVIFRMHISRTMATFGCKIAELPALAPLNLTKMAYALGVVQYNYMQCVKHEATVFLDDMDFGPIYQDIVRAAGEKNSSHMSDKYKAELARGLEITQRRYDEIATDHPEIYSMLDNACSFLCIALNLTMTDNDKKTVIAILDDCIEFASPFISSLAGIELSLLYNEF